MSKPCGSNPSGRRSPVRAFASGRQADLAVAVTVGRADQRAAVSTTRPLASNARPSSQPRSHRRPSTNNRTVPWVGSGSGRVPVRKLVTQPGRWPRPVPLGTHGRLACQHGADFNQPMLWLHGLDIARDDRGHQRGCKRRVAFVFGVIEQPLDDHASINDPSHGRPCSRASCNCTSVNAGRTARPAVNSRNTASRRRCRSALA